MEQRVHLYTLAGVCALPRALSPHRELSPHSDMAALPRTGDATLPLRQLALSPLLCTCGKRTPCVASYSLSTSLVIALTEVIPIAIYHCNISIVSRGKGKSAVAAAAYRSGEKLTNEWDGMTHDYTRKGGVVHTEIMLPPHAPPSFADRSTLWNSVELYEKAGNAQLAREIDAALPIELSREEQIRLVREYCSSQFVSKGMCVDFAIHDTNKGNPHCHIMLTMRPLDERGAWAAKSKKEYDLDENGELNRNIQKANCMIKEIRAQIGKLKEWIAGLLTERDAVSEKPQPQKSPDLANLLMKYLSVQRDKSRKYSQSWQRQYAANELKTVSQAVNYLAEHGISTVAELDASLSSVREKSDAIRAGMKAAEQRMKKLQKLTLYGGNYQKYKPVHDELKKLKNGWTNKRDKYEEAHRAELALWDAASRYLHANLPEGTKSLPICDENGKNYFLDYLVRTRKGKYAVEENGVTYHHPQIIGEEKYKHQLRKQNTCALWGIKLFRFSTEDCAFENRIEDDIKQYFGKDTSEFVDDGLKIDRKVVLYEHQMVSLQEIQKRREAGIKAFLIVLPTAAGKSKIVEEDLREFANNKQDFKGLILVPGVNILLEWEERIKTSLPELKDKIEIKTYAYMARHYNDVQPDYYNYLVVDEAHHAVAPVLKRVMKQNTVTRVRRKKPGRERNRK